uniref:Uncharacterized protein n=1 Tax=Arundo donax TaxID=35708 RepID=A0A0A9C2V6_ARUDO
MSGTEPSVAVAKRSRDEEAFLGSAVARRWMLPW